MMDKKSITQVNNNSLETKVECIKSDGKLMKSIIIQKTDSILIKV